MLKCVGRFIFISYTQRVRGAESVEDLLLHAEWRVLSEGNKKGA